MDANPQVQDTKLAPTAGLPRMDADQRRRALLRMGAGASPVLLTLASGPAAAQACIVASVYMSADTFASRFQGQTLQCGMPSTPAARVASRGAAPAGEYLLADGITVKKVKDVLGDVTSNATATAYSNDSVWNQYVAWSPYPSGNGVLQLLLTLQMAGNPGLPADYAKNIWQNYAGTNSFVKYTATGIDWGTYDLFNYLNRLVDASLP